MAKKQWNELTPGHQAAIMLGGTLQFGLLGAALWDLSKRAPSQINGSKPLWTAAVFVNFFGPLAYFARGRRLSEKEEK